MNTFTVITGIFGIIGFFAGYSNLIPGYTSYIINCAYISLGLFLGLVISILQRQEVKIYNISSKHIFVYVYFIFFGLLVVVIIILQPTNFQSIIGGIGFFILLTMNNILSLFGNLITISQRLILIEHYKNTNDYSEVVSQYSKIIESLSEDDSRHAKMLKKLEEAKAKHVET